MNKKLKELREEIKLIDTQLDNLWDEHEKIQNNRKIKGYSLAVYKCSDSEALEVIKIDKQMDALELKQDNLLKQYNELSTLKYKEESLKEHENFINNKYEIVINNDYNNKIHTNDKDLYINQADCNQQNIKIYEYIDLNKELKHEVNKPILKRIYAYNPKQDIYYISIPHQTGYKPYLEKWYNSKGDILQLIETGYTNNNKEIYTKIINMFSQEIITLHKPFDSASYVTMTKYKENNKLYFSIGTLKHFILDNISKDMQETIDNLLNKLKANKEYKYDIDYIRDFVLI